VRTDEQQRPLVRERGEHDRVEEVETDQMK